MSEQLLEQNARPSLAALKCASCALGQEGMCLPVAEAIQQATPEVDVARYHLEPAAHASIALTSLVSKQRAREAGLEVCQPRPLDATEAEA